MGDSAGGGLSLALCHRLRSEGLPLPDRLVLLSPWVDLTLSANTIATNADVEVMLTSETLRQCADVYANGTALDLPELSPLFSSFDGYPPVLIQVGTEEILLDDALRLAERMLAAGVRVSLEQQPGLWHVWPLFARVVPEARAAIQRIGEYLRLGVPATPT
jgi:acetyl esterase/lipase